MITIKITRFFYPCCMCSGHGHSHEDGVEDSINLRGAVLHVIGDLVQSIGVAVAGVLIWWKQVQAQHAGLAFLLSE